MKLLLDENLPPGLALDLADIFPGSVHVSTLALEAASDQVVWDYATSQGFVIATKDSDFNDLSIRRGHPPKVLWLRIGNCSRNSLSKLLRDRTIQLFNFEQSDSAVLIIKPRI